MRTKSLRARTVPVLLLLGAVVVGYAFAQQGQDPAGGAPPGAEQATPAPSPDAVAVEVNGVVIHEKEINDRIDDIVASRFHGQMPQGMDPATMHAMMRDRVLDNMIDEQLVEQEAGKAGIQLTDEGCRQEFQRLIDNNLIRSGMTQAEFADQVQQFKGTSLDEFCKQGAQDPAFRSFLREQHLVQQRYPDEVTVSDEELSARYAQDKDKLYTRPAEVRASHILIDTQKLSNDEQKAAARKKAEDIRAKAIEPGADFAALARQFSEGPSAPQGGDLGYFPREGAMVEPFAAAAFALPVGGTSEVVETQFGFHVIRVTDKREAKVVTLEEATPAVREDVSSEKTAAARDKLVADLRAKAKIVYPNAPTDASATPPPTPAPAPVPDDGGGNG